MRIALVNPAWDFADSIYFGCRAPHLPLELGYCRALLEAAGHETCLIDAHLEGRTHADAVADIERFGAGMTVVTTAPTYLFWRCAQPELRVPRDFLATLGGRGGLRVAVGPHGSATPEVALAKLGADVVVRGECEEVVAALAAAGGPGNIPGIAYRHREGIVVTGPPQAAEFTSSAPLRWPADWVRRHDHHHHRFDEPFHGPGAEVEASRGCPFNCTFCAKIDFRDRYRVRELDLLLEEIDGLLAQGAHYIYFIDEIFLPQRPLLEALHDRDLRFGVQTRIDLWKPDMIELLGESGCVSVEAGVESLTEAGREELGKRCRLTTDELSDRLIRARAGIPFVQANLIATASDAPERVAAWRDRLRAHGVWANDPVPLYPYPSSPDYRRLWGQPDDHAWERAHRYYLNRFRKFSDIQEGRPLPLETLEANCHERPSGS